MFALATITCRTWALNAGFYNTTDCNADNGDFAYYAVDTGGDDMTCHNVGDDLGPAGNPPYCQFFTDGGINPPTSCPAPGTFDVTSVGVDTALTPPGTTCAFYLGSDCSDDDNRIGYTAGEGCFVPITVTDGQIDTVGSYKCSPPVALEPAVRIAFKTLSKARTRS